MSWFGSIFDAKESKNEKPKAGKDGNYSYSNGTYGQSDYTVRERKDGTYDLYTKNKEGHSHDHIDKDGNYLDNYHDYLAKMFFAMPEEELNSVEFLNNIDCLKEVQKRLKDEPVVKKLKR